MRSIKTLIWLLIAAYKRANGLKIDGRRILVDAERGRTDKHWLPMYLGI